MVALCRKQPSWMLSRRGVKSGGVMWILLSEWEVPKEVAKGGSGQFGTGEFGPGQFGPG